MSGRPRVRSGATTAAISAPLTESALAQSSDIGSVHRHSHFVPTAVVSRCSKMRRRNARLNLLNDLVGEREQLVRHIKGNRLRSLEVDHKLELSWLLHG
jgi:hypothetical protein